MNAQTNKNTYTECIYILRLLFDTFRSEKIIRKLARNSIGKHSKFLEFFTIKLCTSSDLSAKLDPMAIPCITATVSFVYTNNEYVYINI